MRPVLRALILFIAAVAIAGALIWGFLAGRSEQSEDSQDDAPIQAPSRLSSEGGAAVLTFDSAARRGNGIAVATLPPQSHSVEEQANAVVLALQPLLDMQSGYNSAVAALAKAQAAARASLAEYTRLRQLNQNGKNASDRAVEIASAAEESDAASQKEAEQSLALLSHSMRLRWGATVAGWLQKGSPQLDELLSQRMLLLQVTSPYANGAIPQTATLQHADGSRSRAHFISVLPQLDPRLQAPGFLYSVPASSGLIPGMNVLVFLSSGPQQIGVVVPAGAVVWWRGNAWCYIERSPDRFTRQRISTSSPLYGGWFVTGGIAPGARVIASGAQTMLSEEFRSQIQAGQD